MSDTLTTTLDIVKTVGSLATAVGVFIASRQLSLNLRAAKAQHKRAKAERAIALLCELSKSMGPDWRAATKIVESLDDVCLKSLFEGTSFSVRTDQVPLLEAALPNRMAPLSGAEKLSPKDVFALRWVIASYLNSVEFVCHAAMRDVADHDIVVEELKGLWSPERHQTFCRRYRDIGDGRRGHPMIYEFVSRHLEPAPRPHSSIGP